MEKIFVREQTVGTLEELISVMQSLDSLDFIFTVEKLLNDAKYFNLYVGDGPQRFKITIYEQKEVEQAE